MAFAETKSSRSSLRDTNSPQYKAVEWLAQEKVDHGSNWSGYELLQRYALRVLYHSTVGNNNWGDSATTSLFLPTRVCDWPEVGIHDIYCSGNGQQVDLINLADDNLQGTIPDELGHLSALTVLYLCCNQITGTLSSDLGKLTGLIDFDLGVNELTGTIPSQFGQLTALTRLEFYWNQLTGKIPSQLGQLTSLRRLSLSINELTGTVPISMAQMTNMQYLYLYGNFLVGPVPAQFCAPPFPTWGIDAAFMADCISEVACSCCDRCFDTADRCFVRSGNQFTAC